MFLHHPKQPSNSDFLEDRLWAKGNTKRRTKPSRFWKRFSHGGKNAKNENKQRVRPSKSKEKKCKSNKEAKLSSPAKRSAKSMNKIESKNLQNNRLANKKQRITDTEGKMGCWLVEKKGWNKKTDVKRERHTTYNWKHGWKWKKTIHRISG